MLSAVASLDVWACREEVSGSSGLFVEESVTSTEVIVGVTPSSLDVVDVGRNVVSSVGFVLASSSSLGEAENMSIVWITKSISQR